MYRMDSSSQARVKLHLPPMTTAVYFAVLVLLEATACRNPLSLTSLRNTLKLAQYLAAMFCGKSPCTAA